MAGKRAPDFASGKFIAVAEDLLEKSQRTFLTVALPAGLAPMSDQESHTLKGDFARGRDLCLSTLQLKLAF